MEDIKEKTPVIHFNGKTFQFPSKVPVPKSGTVHRPSAKATPKSPDQMLRTPASVISSLQGTPVKNQQSEETIRAPKCHCNKTATQLIVKKEGPTQGRLFWKCTERLCQFFEWDQEEVKHLQRKALQEKEDEEMRQAEMEARAERERDDGPADHGCSGGETSESDAGGEKPTSTGDGIHEEPDVLALRHCGRREDGRSIQQSHAAARDHVTSSAAQKEDDGGGAGGRPERSRSQQQYVSKTGGVTHEHMMRWVQENAPRACWLASESQWNLWAKKQLEEEDRPIYEQQVSQGYWLQSHPAGSWQFHTGILPSFDSQVHHQAIRIFEEKGFWQELYYEDSSGGTLSKSTRKGLKNSMKRLVVAEVFSPPRVSKEATQCGHIDGGSFDLETGYDLKKPQDRRRAMRELMRNDPDLIVICPPCGPFSILQNINAAKHGRHILKLKLAEGREHLSFGMKVYQWQHRRGKLTVFEHPATSGAWEEKEVLQTLQLPGVQRVRADQCRYGLAVKGHFNKKPTDFMVNGVGLARRLSSRCRGDHVHQPLMGGIAKLAQKYPPALCRAMIRGAEEDTANKHAQVWATGERPEHEEEKDLEDLLDDQVEKSGSSASRIQEELRASQDEKAPEEPQDEEEEAASRELTRSEKQLIHKLHCNLGHPGRLEFARALRMARARGAVWRYAKNEYRCPSCESNMHPKPARPAKLPNSFEPCRTLGVDVVFFPGLDVRKAVPVLNMTDLATGYQMLEPLDSTLSSHVWERFYSTWVRVFSMPEVVLVDQGREFGKDFGTKVTEAGALLRTIGARAPWQQGRTERHGGLAKELFVKVREEVLPTSWGEWKMCIHAVEAAKNRLFNRSGFSPAQRQLGYNLRLPGSLGADDIYDPVMMVQSTSADVQRLLEIRHQAMQAFIKHTTNTAIVRAAKARSRVGSDIQVGDTVYVYRVPLQRRRKAEEDLEDREGRRATWVGPGVVVMTEGANAWLSIRGELWKCAKEQLRKATAEEAEARELLQQDFEELQQSMVRRASKRGFRDVTSWQRPAAEEDEDPEEEPPRQRPRIEEPAEDPDMPGSGYSPGTPAETVAEPMEEPERAEIAQNAAESHRRCEMLDGTLRHRPADAQFGIPASQKTQFGPLRRGRETKATTRWGPYRGGVAPEEQAEEEDDEAGDQDLWVFDEARGVIIRHHRQERAVRFTPSLSRGCPVHPKHLTSERKTVRRYGDGSTRIIKENWRSTIGESAGAKEVGPQRWWVGYTEFKLRRTPPELVYMVKRGSDEVREEEITPEEWEGWKIADAAEWSKVEATGAVKVLSEEESLEVEHQLAEAQLSQRILPSRIVRRWKPSEQPGVPPSRKSRWCIRGDKDPDLLDLIRHAPTVTTATLSVVLQIAASMKWNAAIGDLRNAFMQSDTLHRPQGRLFCRQPKGGLAGMSPKQLIEVLAGAYGLGDAPAHWRKSLKRALHSLQFQQSALDPCVFRWYQGGILAGLLVVEVDDLFAVGSSQFFQVMSQLRERFQFGKFVHLREEEQGAAFNGRRIFQRENFDFEIDMEKFVTERMHEVKLEHGRASQTQDDATEKEKDETRAAVGSLTWAAKEGRPDAAAVASLVASSLSGLKVQDIVDLNKCIRSVKAAASLKIRIQGIPIQDLCWGVVTDASYANAAKGKSQGAFAVIAYHQDMLHHGQGVCNLMHWRSGKIHRVVNSTLAAETQSFSRGLAELSWTVTVFNEFMSRDFRLKDWEESAKQRRLSAVMSDETCEELKTGVGIVDAKSLFDHLSKETVGTTSDKRTALEMQVIRQALAETGTQIRWVPHPSMVVDALTKRSGNTTPLFELLETGVMSLIGSNKKSTPAVKRRSLASNMSCQERSNVH